MQDNECNGFGCKWIQNRHDADNDPVLTIIVFSAIALIFVSILNSQFSQSSVQTLPESPVVETYDINP